MSGLTQTHAEYLESRKLDIELVARMGVHSRGQAIAWPYVQNGQTRYVKTKVPGDKAATRCVPPGIEQTEFWNADCMNEKPGIRDVLVITEGEEDASAVLQAGYQFVVSMPSGSSDKAEGARSKAEKVLLREQVVPQKEGGSKTVVALDPRVAAFRRVAILADDDQPGEYLRDAILDLVGPAYCVTPTYPKGCKDANKVLEDHGVEAVRSLVEKAVPARDDGFVDFVSAQRRVGHVPVYEIGIDFLKDHLKIGKPEFLVIGGLGGVGKTTLYQSIVYSLVHHNADLRASILHLEGSRDIPYKRAVQFWKRVNGRQFNEDGALDDCKRWIADKLAFLQPPEDEAPTFEWLMKSMEMQALQRGRNVFVIDPWNDIIHERKGGQSLTEYTAEAIIRMKNLAKQLGLILIVCHHCRIPREDRPPNMYDLSDSQHWAHKADHVVLAWRPWVGKFNTRVEIAKSKDYDTLGRPGHVWVQLKGDGFQLEATPDPIAAERAAAQERKVAEKAEKRKAAPAPAADAVADMLAEAAALPGNTKTVNGPAIPI